MKNIAEKTMNINNMPAARSRNQGVGLQWIRSDMRRLGMAWAKESGQPPSWQASEGQGMVKLLSGSAPDRPFHQQLLLFATNRTNT
jgi:hypothetical protein